jgi:hypothetical protein
MPRRETYGVSFFFLSMYKGGKRKEEREIVLAGDARN